MKPVFTDQRSMQIVGVFVLFCLLSGAGHPAVAEETGPDRIRINQVGYYPGAVKIASVIAPGTAKTFTLLKSPGGEKVFSGPLSPAKNWEASGEDISQADFSSVKTEGKYLIEVAGVGKSHPFSIGKGVLKDVAIATVKSFYYQRCSCELKAEHAGKWSRKAGHPDTKCQYHPSSGHDSGTLSSPGGWYDAGDYGKYIVPGAVTIYRLLQLYERFPDYIPDLGLKIPESGNGRSDLLDEAKYELDWFRTMQDKDGGVYFKLTTARFTGTMMPEKTSKPRLVIGKSTSSTLDFCAVMAMACRLYKKTDSKFAADCLGRAEQAWKWAEANPKIYYKNPADIKTGPYGDRRLDDEFLWAAVELFLATGKTPYKAFIEKQDLTFKGAGGWGSVKANALMSLLRSEDAKKITGAEKVQQTFLAAIAKIADQMDANPYNIATKRFGWGSNGSISASGDLMIEAFLVTKDRKYLMKASRVADYLLGRNATGYCFVTGFGTKSTMHPHHRPSSADGIEEPIPGLMAGGPNHGKQDKVKYSSKFPAKSYEDVKKSYASNEIAIYWNADAAYLLCALDAIFSLDK